MDGYIQVSAFEVKEVPYLVKPTVWDVLRMLGRFWYVWVLVMLLVVLRLLKISIWPF